MHTDNADGPDLTSAGERDGICCTRQSVAGGAGHLVHNRYNRFLRAGLIDLLCRVKTPGYGAAWAIDMQDDGFDALIPQGNIERSADVVIKGCATPKPAKSITATWKQNAADLDDCDTINPRGHLLDDELFQVTRRPEQHDVIPTFKEHAAEDVCVMG